MTIYCGVGTRECGPKTYDCIIELAKVLAKQGWLLRSGGADGSDSAFEEGCDQGKGEKEIFLPWKRFNGNNSELFMPSDEAFELAARIHPAWHALTEGGRKLHARNCHQVLGADLQTPAHLVIAYTVGGLETGGTSQALRLARENGIPIINLGKKETWQLADALKQIKEVGA